MERSLKNVEHENMVYTTSLYKRSMNDADIFSWT